MKLSELLKSKKLTCAIPYATIGQLLEAISETVKDDRERGITLCADGELAFPQVTGTHSYVIGEGCPVGKKKVGTFHTHPRGMPEKSVSDWFYEMDLKDSVSCMGVETESEPGIIERKITCHTFQKNHPEYEAYRNRLFDTCLDAMVVEDKMKTIAKTRRLTDEEDDEYLGHQLRVKIVIGEGEAKGIINPCTPTTVRQTLSIPNVGSMLEEQAKR